MSLDEYHQTCQGFLMNKQKEQVPARKLYQLLYNVNSKNGINSIQALSRHWALPLIDGLQLGDDQIDEMKERWEKAKERNKLMKENGRPGIKSSN